MIIKRHVPLVIVCCDLCDRVFLGDYNEHEDIVLDEAEIKGWLIDKYVEHTLCPECQ